MLQVTTNKMSKESKYKGNITPAMLLEEVRDALSQLRKHIVEHPEDTKIINDSLEEILSKQGVKIEGQSSKLSEDKEAQNISEMTEKLKPLLGDKPKITEYRKLGETLSQQSGVALPNEILKKAKLFSWFHQYWNNFAPYIQTMIQEKEKEKILRDNM